MRSAKWQRIVWCALMVFGSSMSRSVSVEGQASALQTARAREREIVTPGERYRANGLKSFVFGSDYRNLWTTALEAEVLDLGLVGGGLTPVRTGGFGQSSTLHFRGGDGRRYVVRSIDKDPTRRLIDDLRGTFVEGIIQDQISALHPLGALIVDPLLEAAGILHATHSVVLIPDDPRLGEFREDFAGMLGMLVEDPNEGPDNTPGFAGSRLIVSSDRLLERLLEHADERVDGRAFLKARMVDLIVGDKDRHEGQWRWARFVDGLRRVWRPIPEDRDQAFADFDGLLMAATRIARPQQVRFGPDYPSTKGLTFNGWEIDRALLTELDKPVWDSVVLSVQNALTDDVIDRAVARLPASHYELGGSFINFALKARRDDLSTIARNYYRLISRWVDVHATDGTDRVDVVHLNNGDVDVSLLAPTGTPGEFRRYFRRRFLPSETKEVRVYLHGGDDTVRIDGAKGAITVRVIGGRGDDRLVNASLAGARRTRFYDTSGNNTFVVGEGARVDRRGYERPEARDQAHRYALDWGGRNITAPYFAYDPDLGLLVGGYHNVERYGFRKSPYTSRHVFRAEIAARGLEPNVSYEGQYRHIVGPFDGRVRLKYSGNEVQNFYGFGNESVGGPRSFFEVEQRQFAIEPMLEMTLARSLRVAFGPVFKLAETDRDRNADNFISTDAPYGIGSFNQIGAQTSLTWDTRDMAGNARKGVYLRAGASVYPGVFDVESAFGEVQGAVSTYVSFDIPTVPTLALRVGGKKLWGTFPFHEAAFLGGGRMLRGFRSQRFAGDASVYGNAELRLEMLKLRFLIPGRFGIFGFGDAGRVFFDRDIEGADRLHQGYGAGVWMSFIRRKYTISAAIADGDDLTGLYVRAGLLF